MKKLVLLLLVLSVLLLSACNTDAPQQPAAQPSEPAAPAETAPEPATTPEPAENAEPRQMDSLTVVLNFTVQGDHSPFFLADARGYFAEQGIEVDIQRGNGSGDTVQRVAAGTADIGYADVVPLIMAIAEGAEVTTVMGGMMHEPSALFSAAEDANIQSPHEMEGRTIGGPPADVAIVLLEAVMASVGADFNQVEIINMDAATRIPMLVTGEIDAAGSFFEKYVLFSNAMAEANKTMVMMRYDQYIAKYSCAVIVHDDLIANNPDLIKRFVTALLKGYESALEDPDFGASYIMAAHPEFDADYIYASATTLPDVVWDETTRAQGIGVFSSDKMQETLDLTNTYWELARPVSLNEIFTNEFIEWAHANR